jgi:hypothetical protein
MAPDDIELNITDPKIRTKYRAAIRENAQNQSMNSRQEKLRTASEVQVYNLIGDLSEAFATWDNSATTLARYIKEARLTEEEKKKVTDGIAAKLADIKATEESEQPNDNKVRGSMEPPSRKQ